MTKIIAIANNKGGVGKTTTAISLAALFADWNFRVALIDNDPQGNIGVYLGRNIQENKRNMADVYLGLGFKKISSDLLYASWGKQNSLSFKRENLKLYLSNQRLAYVAEDFHKIATLSEALQEIKADYDLIIIDNGPYIGYLTRAALLAADLVLIPTEAGIGGLSGIMQIIKEAESINDRHWRKVMIRVFVNNFHYTEDFDVSNLRKLKALVGSRLYNTYIPANQHVNKSKEIGLPIHLLEKELKTSSRGALAFRILGKNVLKDLFPELFVENNKRQTTAKILHKIADNYLPPVSNSRSSQLLPNSALPQPMLTRESTTTAPALPLSQPIGLSTTPPQSVPANESPAHENIPF